MMAAPSHDTNIICLDQIAGSLWQQMVSIVLLIFLPLFQGAYADDLLSLSGSTTVQKRIIEPTQQLIEQQLGVRLSVRGVGSGVGFRELVSEKTDLAMVSSSLEDLLKKNGIHANQNYQAHLLHTDTMVPIVHHSNPVRSLSWQQLSDIHTGKIRNWRELGGENRPVVVVISHPDSATRAVFRKEVMKGARYVRTARQVKTTRRTVNLVGRHKGGIGVVSTAFIAQARHPERISTVNTDTISRPLQLISKGTPSPQSQRLIDLLQSDPVKEVMR